MPKSRFKKLVVLSRTFSVLYNRNTWQESFTFSASKKDSINILFLSGFSFDSDELFLDSVSPLSRPIIRQI
jgi:hypothetical protein